jgi:hypothetical protein
MSLTLTPEQLADLTGYTRVDKQKAWLKANGFKFRENRYGHPKVDRAHYDARMGVGAPQRSAEPNWAALEM